MERHANAWDGVAFRQFQLQLHIEVIAFEFGIELPDLSSGSSGVVVGFRSAAVIPGVEPSNQKFCIGFQKALAFEKGDVLAGRPEIQPMAIHGDDEALEKTQHILLCCHRFLHSAYQLMDCQGRASIDRSPELPLTSTL